MTPEDLKIMAEHLKESGEFVVLRRHEAPASYAADDGAKKLTAVVLDTECTGLDYKKDHIIELAMVSFEYSPETGNIYRVLDVFDEYADPGIPIPAEITELTGITNEMVAGKRIDVERVRQIVGQASVIIAHNAGFDRKFVEAGFPGIFEDKPWACTHTQLDWKAQGFSSSRLDYLGFKFGFVFDGHRASNDCLALLEILAGNLPLSGAPVIKELLDKARQASVRLYAVGAPFDLKEVLKARGYRWGDGTDGKPKAWWTEVNMADREAELAYLHKEIYGGRQRPLPEAVLNASIRFSARC